MNNEHINEYIRLCDRYREESSTILQNYNNHIQSLYNIITSNIQNTTQRTYQPNVNTSTPIIHTEPIIEPLFMFNSVRQNNANPLSSPRNNTSRTTTRTATNPYSSTAATNTTPMNNISQLTQAFISPLQNNDNNNTFRGVNNLLNSTTRDLITFLTFGTEHFSLGNNQLEPVTVSPSQQQINNATERITYEEYRRCHLNSEADEVCPIDLMPFTENDNILRIKHCKHIFREENILNWFNHNVRCPLCRFDIRVSQTNENNNESESDNDTD